MQVFVFGVLFSSFAFANPYEPPSYQNLNFLANTANEMTYLATPGSSIPAETENAFIARAHGACRALGHNRAKFALPENISFSSVNNRVRVLAVDELGFMLVKEVSYLNNYQGMDIFPTYFKHLECF